MIKFSTLKNPFVIYDSRIAEWILIKLNIAVIRRYS